MTLGTVTAGSGRDASSRSVRRAFVKLHHPDRGGDHEAFVEGMARLEGRGAPGGRRGVAPRPARVVFVRRRHGLGGLLDAGVRRWQRRSAPPRVR